MVEALIDPKTWLFALFMGLNSVSASLTNQYQLIVVSFGFNPLQTTLLGCVSGVVIVVVILISVTIASSIPNSISWAGIVVYIVTILGVLLFNVLPWHDKVGLLFAMWIIGLHLVLVSRRRSFV